MCNFTALLQFTKEAVNPEDVVKAQTLYWLSIDTSFSCLHPFRGSFGKVEACAQAVDVYNTYTDVVSVEHRRSKDGLHSTSLQTV